jgi:hypothetical protein
MHILRNATMPLTAARLALVYHLVGRSRSKHKKQAATRGHSPISAVLVVGFMTVATILAISLLQLLFAAVS